MNKVSFKQLLPHIIAIVLFLIIAFAFCSPVVKGKVLSAHDTTSWRYMAEETISYNETHDDVTLWTNSLFGGMPNYQISMKQPNNVLQYVEKVFQTFPRPVSNLLLYLVGFYILLLLFGVNPWLSIVGSVGFTFASYNMIIIAAGHNSKAITIAYMAPMIGAVWQTFRGKKLLGGVLTTLFLSLAIRANHIQILYYTLIILLIFAIVELIFSIKEKEIKTFLQSSGAMVVALVIALGMNATSLMTTYEYSKYTMRGESNGLTSDTQNSQKGLNTEYITQWSYGVGESMTLLIPNFKGGASGGFVDENSATAKYLQELGVPNVKTMLKQMSLPLYWGTQPFTSGPVYLGAIIIFLFVLSFFLIDKRTLWWLVPTIILTLMLSWGKNFMSLTEFFIQYVPLYNKFRAVSMTLVATGFAIALMAFLALKEIFNGKIAKERLQKSLLISFTITGGITLIFALIPSLAGNFVSVQDAQFSGDYSFLKQTLPEDRKALLRADAWRSFIFIALATGVIFIYLKKYIKSGLAVALLGVLILFDVAPVSHRYLNDKNYDTKSVKQLLKPTLADEIILKDKSQFRILDATVDMFNDAAPSYFHKNIGGYHAAKLRRYQELINMQLQGEIGTMFSTLSSQPSEEQLMTTFNSLGVLNMLNLKYVIYNKQASPLVNPYHNGNAWLVEKINTAADANEEMKMLGEIDTKNELVIDKLLRNQLPENVVADSTATISLKSYAPNHLVYEFSGKHDQVAVFSEIFYPKGWIARIDGKEVPYTRVNYLLRAMPLKAGNYQIDFRFEPSSYTTGNLIALISSIIFILMIIGYLVYHFKKKEDISVKQSN